ncbi:MAG TPA: LytTR family DNA-binding domain-containing protein [Candidatus Rubneribacter avistercoris]|nr:LytTR family DNA-binding domain-containing protein [Candidatus Rubneribacter avistercoris]
MYRVAVLDDEPLFADRLSQMAAERLARRGISCEVERFTAAGDLMNAAELGRFDLYLLDVLLDDRDCTGIDVARAVRSADSAAAIVFVTVSLEYAPEGYGVDAAGYLLKPLDEERFDQVLDRAIARRAAREAVVIDTPQRIVRMVPNELAYLEIRNHTLHLHFVDGHVENVSASISGVLEKMPAGEFVLCHRSFAVRVEAIRSVQRYRVTLSTGDTVPVSRARYAEVQRALMRRFRSC